MTYAQGIRESMVLAKETSPATLPGTVNAALIPVISPDFGMDRNKFRSAALKNSPNPRKPVYGKKRTPFTYRLACNPLSMIDPLTGLNGDPSLSGTAALYQRIYAMGTLPSYTAEARHPDISKYPRRQGLYTGRVDLMLEDEGVLEATFAGMGLSTVNPTPTATVVNGALYDRTSLADFSEMLIRVKKGGSTIGTICKVNLGLDRQLGFKGAMDETDHVAVVFAQIAQITASLESLVADVALLDEGNAGPTSTSFEFFIPGGNGLALLLTMPSVYMDPGKLVTNGTGIVTYSGPFDVWGNGTESQFPGQLRSKFYTVQDLATTTVKIALDGAGPITVTFLSGDDTPDEHAARINGTGGLSGVASVERMAGEVGGLLKLQTTTNGAAGSIAIDASSTGAATIGLQTGFTQAGLDDAALVWTLLNQSAT